MSAARANCPICRAHAARAPYVPFCSERCKMVDLGRWLRGDYVVAGEAAVAFDPELAGAETSDVDRAGDDEGGASGHDA